MKVEAREASDAADTPTVEVRCPHCRRESALQALSANRDIVASTAQTRYRVGMRRCTAGDCNGVVFFVADWAKTPLQVRAVYPPEVLDWDASDLPPRVLAAYEEAIKCHAAACYTACALMVRKTLEVVCDDQGAKGKNLEDRIDALRERVILPPPLFEALHDLRYLGNDAAHVAANAFDEVGKAEVELALGLAKELLRSLYQLQSLTKALRERKKATEPS